QAFPPSGDPLRDTEEPPGQRNHDQRPEAVAESPAQTHPPGATSTASGKRRERQEMVGARDRVHRATPKPCENHPHRAPTSRLRRLPWMQLVRSAAVLHDGAPRTARPRPKANGDDNSRLSEKSAAHPPCSTGPTAVRLRNLHGVSTALSPP